MFYNGTPTNLEAGDEVWFIPDRKLILFMRSKEGLPRQHLRSSVKDNHFDGSFIASQSDFIKFVEVLVETHTLRIDSFVNSDNGWWGIKLINSPK